MPSVIVRQTIDLYGTRYKVGLRDIPEGHQCGHEWEGAVAAGYVEPTAKVSQKAAEVVESVIDAVEVVAEQVVADVAEEISDGVQAFADLMADCDEQPQADQPADADLAQKKPTRKSRS